MATRSEFPAKIKDLAYARSKGRCENKSCGALLHVGKFDYDHILPDALGGKPILANCAVLCESCHNAKTAKEDVPRIRKADRQRRAHIGAKIASGRPIQSAGFPETNRPKLEKLPMPPRSVDVFNRKTKRRDQ